MLIGLVTILCQACHFAGEVLGALGLPLAIGLISGTSMDGIDAALIETDGQTIHRRGPALTHPYRPDLRARLLAIAADPALARTALAAEEEAVGWANLEAAERLLAMAGLAPAAVRVVGMHGQTVLHRPDERMTRQLGLGALVAAGLGIDVVDGFRQADLAAGGQGAPLVPLYHLALAKELEKPLAILNLGGVANVTWLGQDDRLVAFDTGPANAMIDDWVAQHRGLPYDAGGHIAAAGQVDLSRLAELQDHAFFRRPPPKSLDRNAFSAASIAGLSLADGAATLAAFTIAAVARAREHFPAPARSWLVTGGGRHNLSLMSGLTQALGLPVCPVEDVGWSGDHLEAECFGFLAVRSLLGLPLSLPSTTGVPQPMPGGVRHSRPGIG